MSNPRASLTSDPARPSSPRRPVFVLVQMQPRFEVLATSHSVTRLETERDTILDLPWDQDAEGGRELRILPTIHLAAPTHDRRRLPTRTRSR